jgi:trehalose 6-phosphate synthase
MTMPDIIVSHRVARVARGGPIIGGLAAALLPAVRKSGVIWFGASGNLRDLPDGVTPLVEVESHGRGAIARADMPARHHKGFYAGYSNSALWPLLHSRVDLVRQTAEDYACYCAVNRYMARTLATFGTADAALWIHDYHFLPLGRALRRLGIRRKIGFFLHTPWPGRRTWAQLPQHRDLAEAMLAYDLIGFQTDQDRDNFAAMLRHDMRMPCDGLTFTGRYGTCRLATFPIGIDANEFADSALRSTTDPVVQRLRDTVSTSRLVIGVDRVDYTKGLAQRVQAFDHLLGHHPGFRRRLALLQIGVPSRCDIDCYRALQKEVAGLVGDVNARHGEIDWTPIRYINKGFAQSTLAGFYRAAAVGLVTPFRDGMNLVAKEYIAAQDPEDPGVLVLSRFAGAAHELDAALLVDPHEPEAVARQIVIALAMPREERRARWQGMMDTLLRHSIHAWFDGFMRTLKVPEQANVFPLVPARMSPIRVGPSADQVWATHP